ncbi:MAG: alpha/beta fold hydrolase [Steroidobacteraceae bacterium]|nr:alpha/beta fold hydrolase [Steroidobacteraceae bacterium]
MPDTTRPGPTPADSTVQKDTAKAGPASGKPSTPKPAPTADDIDRAFRAALSKFTGGLSPTTFVTAWADWASQLAASPGRQWELQQEAARRALDNWQFAARAIGGQPASPTEGLDGDADKRFEGELWSQYPYNLWARVFQNGAGFLKGLPRDVDGLREYHAELVNFTVTQWLDALSPTNFLATNPELAELTRTEGGDNLMRGAQHLVEDTARAMRGEGPVGVEAFEVGRSVAVTPGKVVYRNALIELLQYSPTTPDVHAEPVLIVPAWIMKYYILDLSPKNSLVKYLVDQGHTVFMVSWKNPEPGDRDFGMDDYLTLGLKAAIDAVSAITHGRKIHATGYCIGGTLLSIGSATLAREGDDRLASVTLFAAQTDFSEPGELSLFINPSQLAMLEAQMAQAGVLDSKQMGGAFQMLRPRDLIWQPMINSYLKGARDPMIDLMAWNADGTRMPYRMHTEYLYRLYLDNELSTGRFPVYGEPVRLSDVRVPMFVVGTETDHVAPWKSVYKVENLVRSDDFTFLLTSGGHNAGIVSGPVHPKRRHRVHTRRLADRHLTPDEWTKAVAPQTGSWWPVWAKWLADHSSSRVAPPSLGAPAAGYAPIEDAPGRYVRMR